MAKFLRTVAALCTFTLVAAVPVAGAGASGGDDAPDSSWIVELRPSSDASTEGRQIARAHGGRAPLVYEHALNGFSFEGSPAEAARLARDPRVVSVVADREVHAAAQTVPTGVLRVEGDASAARSGDGTGAVDVDVAVLDTGIDLDHPDLNVVGGTNCTTESSADDGNGHGSHVAGTIAARDDANGVVGVAPGARLWSAKVLNSRGSGYWSWVICGIDWVAANAGTIEVANMSLGGSGSESGCNDGSLQEAICAAVDAGVTFSVSAGNSDADAAGYVPAAYDQVITVSSLADFDGRPGGLAANQCSDVDDTLSYFSNYGADVDLVAPGSCIYSTYRDGGYKTLSGTSMAAPHVAGAAALYLSANPGTSPANVKSALQAAGNLDWSNVDDGDDIKEKLLNVASGTVTPPPEEDPVEDPVPGAVSATLSGVGASHGKTWTATVTVEVAGTTGGVTVAGRWSDGATGTASCTTSGGATNSCAVTKSGIAKRTGSVTFAVTNVSHADWDGATPSITVAKP